MKLTRFAQKNPVEAGAIALVVVLLILGRDALVSNWQANSMIRGLKADKQTELNLYKVNQQSLADKATIAEDRFNKGCRFVVAAGTTQATTLSENQPVRDPARNAPLPPNTVVCSSDGTTGVIMPNEAGLPVVSEIAFTGNQEVVKRAMQKAGFNSLTQLPKLK